MPMNVSTLTARIVADTTGFNAGLGKAEARLAAFQAKAQMIGKKMTMGVTLPIVAIGAVSTKMAMDFEASMSKITGLVGIAKSEVDKMRGSVLQLAGETSIAPQELADALFFITSAGLRGATAMEALEMAAKASAAGLGETAVVADALTSAMNAYGAENLSAEEATDVLVSTVREGKVEADALAGSLGKVIPAASQMGIEFNEVGAAIATMTRIGLDANVSTTALRSAMMGVLKPTQETDDYLAKLGTTSAELREKIAEKGLFPALMDLSGAVGGNADELAKLFPNLRALTGVLAIVGKNSDNATQIFESMEDSTGALDRAFEEASSTTEFKLNAALSSLKAAMIDVGAIILPVVSDIADGFAKLMQKFSGLNPETKKIIVLFAMIAAALGPIVLLISALLSPITLVVLAIAGLAIATYLLWTKWDEVLTAIKEHPALAALAVIFAPFLAAIFGVIAVIKNWEKIWATIGPPIKAAVDYVTEQIGNLVAWWKDHWNQIKEATKNVMIAIGAVMAAAWVVIKFLWEAVGDDLMRIIKTTFKVMGRIIGNVMSIIQNVIELVLNILTGKWGKAWDNIKAIVADVWDSIAAVVRLGWETIQGIFGGALSLLGKYTKLGFDLVMMPIKKGLAVLRAVWDVAWSAVASALKTAWDKIASIISTAWNSGIMPTFHAIETAIDTVLVKPFNFLRGVASDVWGYIAANISSMWETRIKPAFDAVHMAITTTIIPAFEFLKTAVERTWLIIGNAISFIWNNVLKPIWDAIQFYINTVLIPIFQFLQSVISTAWAAVGTAISFVWNSVIKPVWDAITAAAGFLGDVFTTLKETIGSAWDGILTKITDVWDSMKGIFFTVVGFVEGALSDAWGVFSGAAKTAWGEVEEKIKGVLSGLGTVVSLFLKGAAFIAGAVGLNPLKDDLNEAADDAANWGNQSGAVLMASGGMLSKKRGEHSGFAVNSPVAIVGEGKTGYPEYVIPTDPKYRDRAVALYRSLGANLMQAGGRVGKIDWTPNPLDDPVDVIDPFNIGRTGLEVSIEAARKVLAGVVETVWPKVPVPDGLLGFPAAGVNKTRDKAIELIRGQAKEIEARVANAITARPGNPGMLASSTKGINPDFLRRFHAWNAATGTNYGIVSGFRSSAEQAFLYQKYLAGTGNLAAPPGRSNHERGLALDIAPHPSATDVAIARRFRLHFPVGGEPWHIEPFDRGGTLAPGLNMVRNDTGAPETLVPEGSGSVYLIAVNDTDEAISHLPAHARKKARRFFLAGRTS